MKKLIIIGLIFIISPLKVNAEIVFSDLNNQTEYLEAISFLVSQEVVNGYPNGTMRPYDCVKRVEFLKILSLASEADIDSENTWNTDAFPDVNKESWYWPYLNYSLKEGIVSGYPDGLFRPARCMKRSEAIKMAAETFGYTLDNKVEFDLPKDIDRDSWYGAYFAYVWSQGYIGLNHAFEIGDEIIYDIGGEMYRAEAFEMVYRYMEAKKVRYEVRIQDLEDNKNGSNPVNNKDLICEEKYKLVNDLSEISNSSSIVEITECLNSANIEEVAKQISSEISEEKKIEIIKEEIFISGDFYMQVQYPEAKNAGMEIVLKDIGYECIYNGLGYCNEWQISGKINIEEMKRLEPFLEYIILEY